MEGAAAAAPSQGPAGRLEAALDRLDEALSRGNTGTWLLALVAAVIWLPTLGTAGLWDPWETHYAEVARAMVARGDWVHPYWESAYFFSKPALSFWMMAVTQALLGINLDAGGVHPLAEWAVRLPFATCAIAGVLMLHRLVSHLAGRRAGLLAGLVLATCPQYVLLGKQAMVDMPLVACVVAAVSGLMLFLFGPGGAAEDLLEPDPTEAPATPPSPLKRLFLIYGAYAAMGLGIHAKGLLGLALPGAFFLLFFIVSGTWRALLRMRIPTGALVFAAVAAPWFVYMSFFEGVDDEGRTFFARFFKHDHFNRVAVGVHTTTPGGTFAYYIEQLGYGLFPWSAVALIALLAGVMGLERAEGVRRFTRRQLLLLMAVLWAAVPYVVFTLSVTKFHHYIFPAVPGFAVLVGCWLAELWRSEKPRLAGPAAMLLCIGFFAVFARDLTIRPKHLLDLFVYNYERPYPAFEDPKLFFPALFTVAGVSLGLFFLMGLRRQMGAIFVGLALVLSLFLSHVHFNRMGHHWTQRHLFDAYWSQRAEGERVGAYQMNWRGETYYSTNTVKQLKSVDALKAFVKPEGREWILTEAGRYRGMVNSLGAGYKAKTKIVDKSNNKYYLVVVE